MQQVVSLWFSVCGEEHLSRQALVLPDRMITFPLAGETDLTAPTVREPEVMGAARLAQSGGGN